MTDTGSRDFDVAIIGLSCRLPGSPDPQTFWKNLSAGVSCISRFSGDDLAQAGLSPELLRDPSYVPAGGVLDDIELFDSAFWGYLPRESALLDPQQRIFLECSWRALEDAGYAPDRMPARTGVFGGATMNTYMTSLVLRDPSVIEKFGEQTLMLTNDKDFLPMRVSYKLGLTGPSVSIQAACATSLAAVHFASRSLLAGECDVALAGGASVRVPHKAGYWYREGGTSSPDGVCRAFDAGANGSVPGSGAGVIVLKRYADAIRDRDNIRAIVKGCGLTNDGAGKASFTAPSAEGQTRAILDAFAAADVSADDISYVECHGTATKLGDPIETDGLSRAYREMTDRRGFCAIGSAKPNIGHLDAGAGVAGLIKTVLALENELIPPTVNFRSPNPELRLEESAFFVAGAPLPWRRGPSPRRAGVNSIGMGGVNVHLLLEEAPAEPRATSTRSWFVLPISAKTRSALDRASDRLAAHLGELGDAAPLADVAFTLQEGRAAFRHRRALVCRDGHWRSGTDALPSAVDAPERPAILLLLPGQGTHYAGMGSELHRQLPVFRDAFETCARHVHEAGGVDLTRLLVDGRADGGALGQTAIDQPALFAIEWAMAQTLASLGMPADRLVGHSVGELVAAALAEVMTLEDAAALVVQRGRLMQAAPDGAMIAVAIPEDKLTPMIGDGVSLAAVNGPTQCVVSGAPAVIAAFEQRLEREGVSAKRLRVERAFHSPMMDGAATALEQLAARIPLRAPTRPIYSTVTGQRLTAEEATSPAYWARQIRRPVRFLAAVQAALKSGPVLPIECGPGHVLLGYTRPVALESPPIASMGKNCDGPAGELGALHELVARAWERGAAIDWRLLTDDSTRRIPLPTYPFEGKRAWIDPPREPARASIDVEVPAVHAGGNGASHAPAGNGHPAVRNGDHAPGNGAAQVLSAAPLLQAEITVHPDRIVIRTGTGQATQTAVVDVAAIAASMPAVVPQVMSAAAPPPPRPSPPPISARQAEPPPPAAVAEPAPTDDDVEAKIAQLVEELLGITDVPRDAKLVDLGADSLMLTQLLTRLRKAVWTGLTMKILTESGSIAGIARLARGGTAAAAPAPAPAPAAGKDPAVDDLVERLERLSPDELARELAKLEEDDDDDDR